MNQIESFDYKQQAIEESDKQRAHQDSNANEFLSKLMNGNDSMGNQQQPMQQQPQMAQNM